MSYQHWIFQQEEPQLCEPTRKGYRKKEKPVWVEQLEWQNKMIKEMGADEYFKKIQHDRRPTKED